MLLVIAVLFTIPLSTDVFAQTSYDVNIPTGAADQFAPYFWQSEKDGSTSGIVEILIGDTIVWKNADTDFHDVTSGSETEGPDGIFFSKPLAPGKSFTYKFSDYLRENPKLRTITSSIGNGEEITIKLIL